MPATVQAAIEARIDRLNTPAKRTLNAASVIGARFGAELLAALGIDPVFDELLSAELIDQVRFTPSAEYAFHHPLIRAVAYESQLKSDRAQLHRRLAAAIEQHEPGSADENAALIAEHLEAAGDLHAAYGWHMRAATWATNRDIAAARLSWERARKIADALPAEDPDRAAMRIAPRTMLCGIAWRAHMNVAGARFEELRELCTAAGDKASLAIGMAGLVIDHAYHDRIREASQLASEAMALVESLGDPNLTVGLSFPVIYAKMESAEWSDVLRWSQRVIDLADGDPSKGNFLIGSPLAFALTTRAIARYCLGRPGWRDDLRHGLAMARSADPVSYAAVVSLSLLRGNTEWRAEARRFRGARDRGCPDGLPNDPVMTSRWPSPGRRWAWRWCTATRLRSVTADRSSWPRSATYSCAADTTCANYRSSTCTWRVRGLGVEIAMTPYRSCAPPSTICSARDGCWRGAFLRPVFWWRHCSIAGPTVTWPKPRPPSSGWRPRQPTTDWLSAKSGCCGCGRCWRGRTAMPRLTRTSGSLPRDGDIAWLRRTHRLGRGDDRGWGIVRSGMRRPRSTSSVVVVASAVSGEAHSMGPYGLRMGCQG